MRYPKGLLGSVLSGRNNSLILGLGLAALAVTVPETAAFAQAVGGGSSDPFQSAASGADSVRQGIATLALSVGGIGVICSLMLGFFNKLNWKWVATGIGVSFAIAIVPTGISYLNNLSHNGVKESSTLQTN